MASIAKKKSPKSSRKKKSATPGRARRAIDARIKERGLTGYQVAEALSKKVSRTAVYRFMSDGATTNLRTIEAFLDFLELDVVPKKKASRPRPKAAIAA